MKKFIGWSVIALFFAGLIILISLEIGLLAALGVFAVACLITLILVWAVKLTVNDN